MIGTQLEVENKSLARQIEDFRVQTLERKKQEANVRSEQQKAEDLQRKLKAETDAVTKLQKSQKEYKKVRLICFGKVTAAFSPACSQHLW